MTDPAVPIAETMIQRLLAQTAGAVMSAARRARVAVRSRRLKVLYAAALIGALLASPAAALEPLSKEKYINDRLIAARIADRIRRSCPTIDGRILYAYGEARKLKSYARNKGYSNAQIDAFLDSKDDKKRIYAVAEDYLKRKGARADDAQSFCAVGRQEIVSKTIIGSLLVAK